MKRAAATLVVALLTLGVPGARALADVSPTRAAEARRLYEKALKRLARGNPAQNQMALAELERAALLNPDRLEYALALGSGYLNSDMLHQARHWAEVVLEQDSSNAAARFLIGSMWRKDWLITADDNSLDRAVIELSRSARQEVTRCDHWLLLVPLLVERGELAGARTAAQEAWDADSNRAESWLARAYTFHRSGDLAQAAALFDQGLVRLPAAVRFRFEDVTLLLPPPIAKSLESASPGRRAAFARRFWEDADPDLVTPVNEARLEFLARATHAYFLYYRPQDGDWDARGDLYVRYGPPRWADRNPALQPNYLTTLRENWMVWGYPELGMRIWLLGANPLGSYLMPIASGGALAIPFADSLNRRPDLLPVPGGFAVFPRIPPGAKAIPVQCALARFETEGGRRLLAHVECPGSPAESLLVEWAVFDSTRHERARESHWMTASACAPGEARATSFAADLPPGRYRVGVSVRDGDRRRGVVTSNVEIRSMGPALGLSDVVVACGPPQTGFSAGQSPRIELNPGARVRNSDQLTAYFEIYHLAPGPGGWSRFEYVYTVRAEADSRVWLQRTLAPRKLPPPIEASREEETSGPVRRQFVTVPIRGLPAGRYEIEIRVRDLITGTSTSGKAQFTREG